MSSMLELPSMLTSLNGKTPPLIGTARNTTAPNFLQYPNIENRISQLNNDKLFTNYTLNNITPNQCNQTQLKEITHSISLCILNQTISTEIRPHSYCYERKKRRRKKHPLFLPLKSILRKVFPKPRKSKYKERRKFYNCTKKCYEDNPEYHLAYLMQEYNIAYEGDIFPSRKRLAEELQVCERTIDKTLKNLKFDKDLYVQSGKKNWTTNQYSVPIKYQKTPLIAPPDYIRPKILHWILSRKFSKAKCPKLKHWIGKHFRRQKPQFAHYSFQEIKKLRISIEEAIKNFFKSSKDPPKSRGRPILWHLLKQFTLPFKDKAILSSFGEAALRAAIDDMTAFTSWGKEVDNVTAFLISRCKAHREKSGAALSKETPDNILKWLKRQLIGKPHIKIIQSEEQVDRMDNRSTFVKVLVHKSSPLESIILFWKKINGYWIDKRVPLKHERLMEAVSEFIDEPKWKAV